MSYSLQGIFESSSWAIAKNSMALAALQLKAATGQEINRVSEDPTKANQILGLLNDSRSKEQYMTMIDELVSVLDLSSSVSQSIFKELSAAGTKLTSCISATSSEQLRRTTAGDLNNSLEQLVALANTQRMGQSLYAGDDSAIPPYTVQRNDKGQITRVIYQGSYEELKVQIADGLQMSALLVGDRLFRNDTREAPVFIGSTGAAGGAGTSSVRGDTTLTITGTPGNWQLSIDGGLSTVTVTGSETSVPVVNARTGEVLYVDATGIKAAGSEPVRVPGTYDMFNILINARDLLAGEQTLTESQYVTMMSETIRSVQGVEQKLVQVYPVVGGRIQTLTSLRDTIEEMKMNSDDEVALLRDADVTQVAIDLARYQTLYEMSLNVAAKMFSLNMLDFLD
ncbi:MAG: flagellar hook-associated protein FlgL [Planctomycetaceae bacterium]|nr:flagellar hook-associated protein FlgL [Planctomycetaceae bacterium]